MATNRPVTPSAASYNNPVPHVDDPSHISRGYGSATPANVGVNDFANTEDGAQNDRSRLGRFEEDFDARTRGTSIVDGGERRQRSSSRGSTLNQGTTPSRSGTLKKKSSIKRSGSRKSVHAGSIRGVTIDDQERGYDREDSVFYTPVPTKGAPTEVLAERFQTWRKFLKDLITYFREVASSYEHRGKSLLKVSNVINNTNVPSALLLEGGLNDANRILRDFHKQSITEANKARDIEADVINQLSGLRADLAQKIKEIKSLSGDFKNNVEREKENTRKCVTQLEEALAMVDSDPSAAAGKGDPYVVRLGVERQVERQIDEENYLHRAYLNLENSGRELESIVVGEIQKAYNALATILKRDADEMYNTAERLREGPIALPRDHEWSRFVRSDPHFVNPDMPLRRLEDIQYPGKFHPATTEVRAGMLERKSKYLKSYTPGWYVLSPTHLHEFKSADRIYTQPPVMSLYLPDQKLGSRSQPGNSSHKFVIKGRQAGSMHRGHTWVFRAETYETMMAWFDDITALTEKSGEERNAFVRRHASVRSTSVGSARSASSADGLEEDEADAIPFSANQSMKDQAIREQSPQRSMRPSPGGRFPSDLMVNRNLQAPLSPSSGSSEVGNDLTTMSGGPPQDVHPMYLAQSPNYQGVQHPQPVQVAQPVRNMEPVQPIQYALPIQEQPQTSPYPPTHPPTQQLYAPLAAYDDSRAPATQQYPIQSSYAPATQQHPIQDSYAPATQEYPTQSSYPPATQNYPAQDSYDQSSYDQPPASNDPPIQRHGSNYGKWMAPAAGGAATGALAAEAYRKKQLAQQHAQAQQQNFNEQTEPQYQQQQQYPVEQPRQTDYMNATPTHVPERHPDHIMPDQIDDTGHVAQSAVPESSTANHGTGAETPATTSSFLGESEVGAAPAFGKTVNGGPVPVELVDTAESMAHPGIQRMNTDMSISDLHVPGEFPRATPISEGSTAAGTTQQPATFLRYN